MVHKWLYLSCGGLGLVDMRSIQILVSINPSFLNRYLTIYLKRSFSNGDLFSRRGVFIWAGTFTCCKFYFHCPFVSHLTRILQDHQLVPLQARYNRRVLFHWQNNQSLRHTCPKASWVLVLSGCGKSLLHRGVGRQMCDCTPG